MERGILLASPSVIVSIFVYPICNAVFLISYLTIKKRKLQFAIKNVTITNVLLDQYYNDVGFQIGEKIVILGTSSAQHWHGSALSL